VTSIDLNADLGEECADDRAMLDIVTTANVAAGGHAGGGSVLDETVRAAAARGVAIGAHPSYVDRAGFGRTSRLADHDDASLTAMVRHQLLEVVRACTQVGAAMTHVKAHGALYHDVTADEAAAEAMLVAVGDTAREIGASLAVVGPPTGVLRAVCDRHGVHYVAEGFADRAYLPDGRLVDRSIPGAVLHDADEVVAQALSIALDSSVRTISGDDLPMGVETLCLHGDTPGAVALATAIRSALVAAGVRIEPVPRA